ncbi:major facilitator superfamily MFS_1 [Catenulispora acidiphila DSM 44928]|uniref:Major facilitator superfamily MFS_1 n=1 Tax=Catenulispora acidiphila (strain DSM 44928 / JCM 14897 / NBRC 102108 / NRRL B-24433 / ID139908) TaxID=479433 RepID=C7QDK5_CATAD|nr:MFS transporter [Catenulispora acidiphila]ACU74629.1 major facilitator superfamily MFS_1 [Catenulispora acidiphila DSM 44928]
MTPTPLDLAPASTPAATPAAGTAATGQRSLRLVMLVLAFACGASVANLYYAQPLLEPIGRGFGVGTGTAALIVTLTQIGYAIGLALLLPLGDLRENRSLASGTLVVTALALGVAALAPDFAVFLIAIAFVGLASVVAQVLVPLAAHLAPEETRGKYVGQVTGGLLLGIMLARSASSLAAAAWGWRSIYAISAGVMLLTALAVVRLVPRRRPDHTASYASLVASSVTLARTEPILRRRALSQALMFGAFTAYWTAIADELTRHHGMNQTGVAIFALVGAAGAASAPIAGRLGDRGHAVAGRAAATTLAVAALLLAAFGASSVAVLVISAVLLDFAVQGHHVLSLRDIYTLRPEARARMNSVYMTGVFAGGAVASAVTGAMLTHFGWSGVALFAAALTALAALLWLAENRHGDRV